MNFIVFSYLVFKTIILMHSIIIILDCFVDDMKMLLFVDKHH